MTHVASAPHESRGTLLFTEHGAAPYWATRKLYQAVDGYATVDVELPRWKAPGTREWQVQLNYSECGLEPTDSDPATDLYEYDVKVTGPERRHADFTLSPRLDWGPEKRPQSVPSDLDPGVAVRMNPVVNLELDQFAWLLPRWFDAVTDEIGYGWREDYFAGPIHEYSAITQHERYVRLEREQSKKVIRSDGIFRRLFELLADRSGSKIVYSADNTEIVGYNHQLRFDADAARDLLPGAQYGKQLKYYHPKYTRDDPDDPLFHPKVGALFKKGLNDGAVSWDRREDLVDELEGNLINALEWSNVSTRPNGSTFVADDVFEGEAADGTLPLYDDPTPEIEASQESVIIRTMRELTDSDLDVLDEVAMADGGQPVHVDELEGSTEWSTSTIYRALSRLGDLVKTENGAVRFASEKIRGQVLEIVSKIDDVVEAGARALESVLEVDERDLERKGRAFQNWLNRYAGEIERDLEGPGHGKLRLREIMSEIKSHEGAEFAPEVLYYGLVSWDRAGRDPRAFRDAIVSFRTPSGDVTTKKVSQLLGAKTLR